MVATQNGKATLWREAWGECKRNAPELLPWILGFSALLTICNFYIVRDQMQAAQTVFNAIQQSTSPDDIRSLLLGIKEAPVTRLAEFCSNIISFVGFYYFTVLYLQREPLTSGSAIPELNLTSFWKWLVQIVKSGFCIVGICLIAIIGSLVVAGVTHLVADTLTSLVGLIGSLFVMLVLIYASFNFFLVGPLTLSSIEAPVKTSWNISKRRWWQLFWNYMGIGWSVFVVFFLGLVVLALVTFTVTSLTLNSVFVTGGLSLLLALFTVTNLAISCVYFCVAGRFFLAEDQENTSPNSNPSIQ